MREEIEHRRSWRAVATTLVALLSLVGAAATQTPPATPPLPKPSPYAELTRQYLWPASTAEREAAEARLASDQSLIGLSRGAFLDLEEDIRRGPPRSVVASTSAESLSGLQELTVEVPAGPAVPVLVQLPPRYSPETEWPLMFAMHGGPPGQPAQARSGAERMIRVWKEAAARTGWIVAAPAMTPSVTAGPRSDERLPYEIFHPEQARAVVTAVRARYSINPDRIVSTGISLGSNYSIALAAGMPGWLSAIVPVSTEGDSRELLLRNLQSTPVYVLEGAGDRNIRMIDGPRQLADILVGFGYDITYREFGDRAHEGFQEHYDDVLRWLDARPRRSYPREVTRVPHGGIVPVSRRVLWLESDTRQGLLRAAVIPPDRIDVTARWARAITLFLHDQLVDLDRPVTITVNGTQVFKGMVKRSGVTALEEARYWGDERRIAAARVRLDVPNSTRANGVAEEFSRELAQKRSEGTLSFWEMYATRALEERMPSVGFEATEVPLPSLVKGAAEQMALRVDTVESGSGVAGAGLRPGDVLVEFAGEPFFRGRGAAHLRRWLIRDLRSAPLPFPLILVRGDKLVTLDAKLQLGPYRPLSGAPENRR